MLDQFIDKQSTATVTAIIEIMVLSILIAFMAIFIHATDVRAFFCVFFLFLNVNTIKALHFFIYFIFFDKTVQRTENKTTTTTK